MDAIERQKKLTPELREKIAAAFDLDTLEDLYLPYKQKRKSKRPGPRSGPRAPGRLDLELRPRDRDAPAGTDPRDLGLHLPEPGERSGRREGGDRWRARHPRRAARGDAGAAGPVRAASSSTGFLASRKTDKAKPNSKYENYFAFHEKIAALRDPANSHRYLAMRRGAAEGELTLSRRRPSGRRGFRRAPGARLRDGRLRRPRLAGRGSPAASGAACLQEHVLPAIENEVHRELKDAADEAAIQVFAENVRRCFSPRPSARSRCSASTRACAPAASWPRSTPPGPSWQRGDPPAERRGEGPAREMLVRARPRARRRARWPWATAPPGARPRCSSASRCRGGARASVRPGQRGGGERLQRERDRARGVPRARRHRARARSRSRAASRTRWPSS